jgi:hypothetical protein
MSFNIIQEIFMRRNSGYLLAQRIPPPDLDLATSFLSPMPVYLETEVRAFILAERSLVEYNDICAE